MLDGYKVYLVYCIIKKRLTICKRRFIITMLHTHYQINYKIRTNVGAYTFLPASLGKRYQLFSGNVIDTTHNWYCLLVFMLWFCSKYVGLFTNLIGFINSFFYSRKKIHLLRSEVIHRHMFNLKQVSH